MTRIKQRKLLRLPILAILAFDVLLILLIYFAIPTDVYYQHSAISKKLLELALILNSKFTSFPSFLIPYLQNQSYIATIKYLPNTLLFALWALTFLHFKKKNDVSTGLFLASSLLIYIETFVNLKQHKLQSLIYTPVILTIMILWKRNYKVNNLYYFSILVVVGLWLGRAIWSAPLENIIFNKLQLFFIPISFFDYLPVFLLILSLLMLTYPLLRPEFKLKTAIFVLVGIFFVFCILSVKTTSQFGESRWIWADIQTNDQYLKFKKNLYVPGKFAKQAKATITAKSRYRLFLNGQFVGEGPGPIDEKRLYFDEYDLSSFLREGKNQIEIFAYSYNHETHFQKQIPGGVLAEFSYEIAGLKLALSTNRTWLVTGQTGWQKVDLESAKVKHHEINSGLYREIYDFTPQAVKFKNAKEALVEKKQNLYAREILPLSYSEISPKLVFKKDGALWFDFEKVVAGFPQFTFKASGSTTITAQYFEDWESSMVQKDKIITDRAGEFTYKTFGRRGMRLIKVTTEPDADVDTSVKFFAVSYPAGKVGDFKSSDELLNKTYRLGEDTLKYAMQNQFEDSFVHERSQYLGDAYVEMLMGFYSLDSRDLAKKALYEYASSQKPTGLIETVFPSSLNQTILSYNLLFVSFLKDYYLYTNDEEALNQLLPTAEKIVAAVSKLQEPFGLINQDRPTDLELGQVLTGWTNHLSPGDVPSDTNLILTAFYTKNLADLEELYKERDVQKSEKFGKLKEEQVQKNRELLSGKNLAELEPHALVAFLWSNTFDAEFSKIIYDSLRVKNPTFITGYFNLFYLMVMQQFGDAVQVKNLMNNYWGEMLRRGAVSTWETFDPRISSRPQGSLTHAWAGTPTYFLPAYVGGIRPASPGFKSTTIEPMIITDKTSTSIKASCGEISVDWEKSAKTFTLNVQNGCGGKTFVRLPFLPWEVVDIQLNNNYVVPTFSDNKLNLEVSETDIQTKVELR
ncbi:alpha-L-rhamnosidase N-terminal domain-containing protein [Candidatus Curtissbacteria bacterium]|nr:alpha-L-rhamnosidase N-terminal domain-containing protein [Candidatus Curtissbacteria bacterium]